MKSFKGTLVLLFFVLILAAGALYFREGSRVGRRISNENTRVLLSRDLQNLDRIQITSSEIVTTLKKSDNSWNVDGLRVNADSMTQLLASLEILSEGEQVSRNPENWDKYGVGDAAPSLALFSGDDRIALFHLGNPAVGNSVYLRKDYEEHVYRVETDLSALVSQPAERWRNRKIIPFSVDTLESFQITQGENSRSFVKDAEQWSEVSTAQPLPDSGALDQLLLALNSQPALQFIPNEALFVSDFTLQVQTLDGESLMVSIDVRDDQTSAVRFENEPDTLLFSVDLSQSLQSILDFSIDADSGVSEEEAIDIGIEE